MATALREILASTSPAVSGDRGLRDIEHPYVARSPSVRFHTHTTG